LASSLDDGQQWNDRRVPVVSSLDATSHDPSIVLLCFWLLLRCCVDEGKETEVKERKQEEGSRTTRQPMRCDAVPPTHNEQGHDEVQRSCAAVIDGFISRV
jgi:hypothetical protein